MKINLQLFGWWSDVGTGSAASYDNTGISSSGNGGYTPIIKQIPKQYGGGYSDGYTRDENGFITGGSFNPGAAALKNTTDSVGIGSMISNDLESGAFRPSASQPIQANADRLMKGPGGYTTKYVPEAEQQNLLNQGWVFQDNANPQYQGGFSQPQSKAPYISSMQDAQTDARVQALKQAIANSVKRVNETKTNTINQYDITKGTVEQNFNNAVVPFAGIKQNIGTQYVRGANRVDVNKANALRQAAEQAAVSGAVGGMARQETANINTAAGQQRNDLAIARDQGITNVDSEIAALTKNKELKLAEIEQVKKQIETQAQTEIDSLTAQGDIQAAQAVADGAAEKFRLLLEDATRVENDTNALIQKSQENARANASQALTKLQVDESIKDKNTEQALADYKVGVAQYANQDGGYMAEINRLKTSDDPLKNEKINILTAARESTMKNNLQKEIENISQYAGNYETEIERRLNNNDPLDDALIPSLRAAAQQEKQANATKEIAQTKQAYTDAVKRWETAGYVVSDSDANILGVPKGTKTNDASYRDAQIAVQQANAANSANKPTPGAVTETNQFDMLQQMKLAKTPWGERQYTDQEIIDNIISMFPNNEAKQIDWINKLGLSIQ